MIRTFSLLSICTLLCTVAFGQSGEEIEMADALFQNGKIYIVVACALIIMIGLFLYLIRLERKVSQLEKKLKDSDQNKFHS